MKGYKTIFTNIALGGFALAAIFGFDVTPEQEAAILEMVLAIGALVNIYLRFITDGPVFNRPRNVVNKQNGNANVDILCGWCMLCLLGLIILFACSGCSWFKTKDIAPPLSHCIYIEVPSPDKLYSCYKSVEMLAKAVDGVADAELITKEHERKMLSRLSNVVDILNQVRTTLSKEHFNVAQKYLLQIHDEVKAKGGQFNEQ